MSFKLLGSEYGPEQFPIVETLPKGVYLLKDDYNRRCVVAKPIAENFSLPQKLYGHSDDFTNRIVHTIQNTQGNVGMLFYGYQGTGKTIAGKVVSNKLNCAVLLIQERVTNTWLTEFLNAMTEPFVLFVDEYEKVYVRGENELLSILDGVFATKTRFTFIATANQPNISPYMYNRPSRIRYVREFGFVTPEVIAEVVNDKLERKELIDVTNEYLATKKQLTIDVISAFITEVNIHKDMTVAECGEYFNFAKDAKPVVAPVSDNEPEETFDDYDDE